MYVIIRIFKTNVRIPEMARETESVPQSPSSSSSLRTCLLLAKSALCTQPLRSIQKSLRNRIANLKGKQAGRQAGRQKRSERRSRRKRRGKPYFFSHTWLSCCGNPVREFLAVCVFFFFLFSFLWPSGCCFFLLPSSGRDVAAAVLATSNSCGSFAWYGSQIQIGKSLCLVSLMFYCFFSLELFVVVSCSL